MLVSKKPPIINKKILKPFLLYDVKIKTLIPLTVKSTVNKTSFVDLSPLLFILKNNDTNISAININRLFSFNPIINIKFIELKEQFIRYYKYNYFNDINIVELFILHIKRLTIEEKSYKSINSQFPDITRFHSYSMDNIVAFKEITHDNVELFFNTIRQKPLDVILTKTPVKKDKK